ncbi:MAG: TonB family protein [Candidatus Eisenbacteria bacterium]|nr:TonB family protein [Candidatus Eisenbacteria bacterium]
MTDSPRKPKKGWSWTFRRAVVFSLVLHVVGVFVAVVWARADFKPPEEERIPVQLIAELAAPQVTIPPEPKPVVRPKEEPQVADPLNKPEKKYEPKPPEPKVEEKPPVKPPEKQPEPPPVETKIGDLKSEVVPKKAPERPTLGDDPMQIEVEGPPFEFAYYLKQVRRKLATKWSVPAGSLLPGQETKARVYFRIQRGGRIIDAKLENESSVFLFDQSVLRALEKASPMPPLPAEYEGEWLGLHVWFVEESQ